jgi:hypothetical protein
MIKCSFSHPNSLRLNCCGSSYRNIIFAAPVELGIASLGLILDSHVVTRCLPSHLDLEVKLSAQ